MAQIAIQGSPVTAQSDHRLLVLIAMVLGIGGVFPWLAPSPLPPAQNYLFGEPRYWALALRTGHCILETKTC